MISDIKLSELLTAKLCHDLAGPIGAVSNGAELLRDDNEDIKKSALDLVDASAKDGVARILFFRMAYGAAKSDNETSLESIKTIVNDFFLTKKIEVFWQNDSADYTEASGLDHNQVKIILNLILISANMLIYGGNISVMAGTYKKEKHIYVKADGREVKIDPEVLGVISDKKAEHKISVKNVNAYLLSRVMDEANVKASVTNGGNFVEIIVK